MAYGDKARTPKSAEQQVDERVPAFPSRILRERSAQQ